MMGCPYRVGPNWSGLSIRDQQRAGQWPVPLSTLASCREALGLRTRSRCAGGLKRQGKEGGYRI